MAISKSSLVTVNANGVSDWVKIPSDGDRVGATVTVGNASATWGEATEALLEYCPDPTQEEVIVVPVKDAGESVVFTENDMKVLEDVRGSLRINVSSYAGSAPISLHVV
ncbi:hypothetical protein [Aureliella helgolandensis]|uniref:Uncharacterized protein n=1 Tax=Aureliella helgolandensis TaxID=2527968 RepID=A0A518GCM6_9BACT|nr:hypothetical protein [Aureliella helgolandensis]QDV26351.1 hypothetical protein Q31a_47240 [Aureliella helgolandensis]